MKLAEFDYALPEELIAQAPLTERTAARLLLAAPGQLSAFAHHRVGDLPSLLRAGDLLVFNDTRVIPARLFARKATGGGVELLLTKPLGDKRFLAMLRNARGLTPGDVLTVGDGLSAVLRGSEGGGFFTVELVCGDVRSALERHGHIPLPPYIRRADGAADRDSYQTMFADPPGSAAAPTAGLHFTPALMGALLAAGVASTRLTLHVGPGTFLPVRENATDDIHKHEMHSEWFQVPESTARAVTEARARGGRVIAVGTTSARALESTGGLAATGETRLFVTPGYRFSVVQGLLTNFHLPKSTLLMLVAGFVGLETMRAVYAEAVAERYRFFSYGDACLFLP